MPRRFSDHEIALYRNKHGENIPVPPKLRKHPRNEESRIQQAIIQLWAVACKRYGVPEIALMAIPNGGRRDAITGSILKREGCRSGAADLFLAVPRGGAHGMFLEIKTPTGTVSAEQRAFLLAMNALGYVAVVRYGFDEAKAAIEDYMKL